jgi:hypothetical protein
MVLVMVILAAVLGAGSVYAADTSVTRASISTPGSENEGNPIPAPDKGTAGAETSSVGQSKSGEIPGGTMNTQGSENKGNPIP